jgi:hypothetical protein
MDEIEIESQQSSISTVCEVHRAFAEEDVDAERAWLLFIDRLFCVAENI